MMIRCGNGRGFTLLEIILTLVIVAVVGTMVFTFLRGLVVPSSETVFMTQDLAEAQSIMEENVAEYSRYLQESISWDELKSNLSGAQQEIQGEINGGYDFEIIEVTISFADQSISALFSE